MRSTPLAMMSAAAVLVLGSGPALGAPTQDDSFGTLEEMVVDFQLDSYRGGPVSRQWRYARHRPLEMLLTPLQLMVDLGMNQPWNPLGVLALDGSADPVVVTASEGTIDRLQSRLGWMSVEAGGETGGETGFQVRSMHRGVVDGAMPTCWTYEATIRPDDGAIQTRFLWPPEGPFCQVPEAEEITWDQTSIRIGGVGIGDGGTGSDAGRVAGRETHAANEIPKTPVFPGLASPSLPGALGWLGRHHFDLDHQLLDPDPAAKDDLITVRNLQGEIVREIEVDFDGERLDRLVIHQRPVKTSVLVAKLRANIEGLNNPEPIPMIESHERWADGLMIEIDFVEAGAVGDAPSRIRATVGGQEIHLAVFEWIASGGETVELEVAPDYDRHARLGDEFEAAWSESLDRSPEVFANRMRALAAEVGAMSQELGLGASEPLRTLERRIMVCSEERLDPLHSMVWVMEAQIDSLPADQRELARTQIEKQREKERLLEAAQSIKLDMVEALLEGPFQEQFAALSREEAIAEIVRQSMQRRLLLSWFGLDAMSDPRQAEDVQVAWWKASRDWYQERADIHMGHPSDVPPMVKSPRHLEKFGLVKRWRDRRRNR